MTSKRVRKTIVVALPVAMIGLALLFSHGLSIEADTEEAVAAPPENAAQFSGPSVYCGMRGSSLEAGLPAANNGLPSFEYLAWMSHEVVVGTVVEEAGVRWSEPLMTGPEVDKQFDGVPLRALVTDYLIDVEYRLRGGSASQVRVALPGGAIDDCVIQYDGVSLYPGERVLLFLRSQAQPFPADSDSRPVLDLSHGNFGVWAFVDDEEVVPKRLLELAPNDSRLREMLGQTWPDFQSQLLNSLTSGAPPEGITHVVEPVPLQAAPVRDSEP